MNTYTPPDKIEIYAAALPRGAQLWGTYQQAGDPPHFTWLNKRQRGRKP